MTDVMNFTKQAFTWSVVAMTIVWSLGLAALAPVAASAATCATIDAGDLVKFGTAPAVYVVDEDNALHTFTSPEQLASWGLSNADVTGVDAACINNYSNPSSMAGRGYSYGLMKPEIGATVYLLALDGAMYSIPTAEVATQLWGENWGSLMRGIAPFLASNYRINSATALDLSNLPDEILVSYGGKFWVHRDGTVYPVEGTLNSFLAARAIIGTDAMVAGLTVSETAVPVSSLLSVLRDFDMESGSPSTPVGDGELMVSLSAAGGDVDVAPVGARVDLLALNFRAGDEAVEVEGLTITKSALMNGDDIADVGIYVGSTRVGNERDSFNSDNEMNFNFPSPIRVNAGSTVTVMVKGRVASSTGSFLSVMLADESDVTTDASVDGSFPIGGSRIAIASGVTAGTLEVSVNDDGADTANFGDDDVTLVDISLDNTGDEDVLLEEVTFENGGNGEMESLIENARLLIDGEEMSTEAMVDGDFITFVVEPYLIEEGEDVTVEVLADIGAGEAGDTLELHLGTIEAYGQDLGFRAAVEDDSFDRASEAKVVTVNGGDVTMNFNRSAEDGTPAMDVRPDTDNVVIATFEITSEAEDLEIFSIGDTSSDNFSVVSGDLDANDLVDFQLRQVGSGTYDVDSQLNAGNYRLAITDDIYLEAGETAVFELIADFGEGIDEGDEFYVTINEAAFDYEGVTSESDDLDFVPTVVESATITVEQASLDITNTQLTSITVVEGATNVVVYQGKLKASTASDLRVTTLDFTADNAAFNGSNVTNVELRVMDGATTVYTKSKSGSSIADGDGITFSGINFDIPAGKTLTVELRANFASNFDLNAGPFTLTIYADTDVTARTTGDGTSYNLVGADIEFLAGSEGVGSRAVKLAGEGSMSIDLQVDETNWNSDVYVLAGGTAPTGRYLAEVRFETNDEAFELRELVITASGTAGIDDIAMLQLVDSSGNVVVEEAFEGTTTTFEDIAVPFAQDELKSLFLTFTAKSINAAGDANGTADEAATTTFSLAGATVYGMQSRVETPLAAGGATPTDGEYDAAQASNMATIVGSRLNSVVNAVTTNQTLLDGTNRVIGSYTFTFERGANRYDGTNLNGITVEDDAAYRANLEELILTITTSTAVEISNVQAYLSGDSSTKTATATVVGSEYTLDLTTLDDVDGTVTLVIEADVSFTDGTSSVSLSTEIADLSTDFSFNGYSDALLKYSEVTGGYYAQVR